MSKQHIRVELYHDFEEGGVHKRSWVQRAPYTRDEITVERDRGDEQGEPTTGSASLTFPGHDLNPNNVASPLYGRVQQNTPLRILAGPAAALTDDFTRTVVDGWNVTRYGFDATAEGWVGEGATSVARVVSPVHDGAGSLQATKTMGAQFDAIRFNDASGLADDISAGGTTLAVWAQVPAGAPGTGWLAHLEVQDSTFTWRPGPDTAMTPGAWALLEFTPPAGLLANCRAVGVQFSATGVGGSQSVYIDTVRQYTPGVNALWTLSGGTNPGDYDVNGFEGTHTHTDTGVYRISSVDTGSTDHLVRAIFDLSAADVTGNPVTVQIRCRKADNDNYYALEAQYSTGEVVTLQLAKRVAGVGSVISGAVTVPFTGGGSGGNDMIGELYVEGNRIYGKVWYRYVDEPLEWMVSTQDDSLTAGTLVALSGRRETGNTNANLQIRWHDFLAVPGTIRFAGECASFKPRRSVGEYEEGPDGVPVKGDRWVGVTAAGVLRRMGQGDPPAYSALWVEILRSNPAAFYPVTEGSNATRVASALSTTDFLDVSAVDAVTGAVVPVDWSTRSLGHWLEPLATPATGVLLRMVGPITMSLSTTAWSADFTFAVDPEAANVGTVLCLWKGTGAGTVDNPRTEWVVGVFYDTVEERTEYELSRRQVAGGVTSTVVAGGPLAYATGQIFHLRLSTVFAGGNVGWEILLNNSLLDAGDLAGSPWQPLGSLDSQSGSLAGSVSFGMLSVWAGDGTAPGNAANAAVVGRSGELAADRLARLCLENDIPFELLGDAADTTPMGPQSVNTFVGNVAEIERTETGRIFESSHQPGLTMRTRRGSLYNQDPALTLDVDDEGVAPDLQPDVDDLGVVNDVTVVRTDGSSARVVDDTGPLGVNTVGRYPRRIDINPEADESLADHAGWRVNLYTQKATRYPQVVVDLDAVPSLMQAAARVKPGDVIALDNAEPDQARLMVLGFTETIGSHRRRITLNTGPAGGYDVFVLGVDRLDHGGASLANAETATSTAWEVATAAGLALCSTTSEPYDLVVVDTGERVTVTAMTGASSPQTATVTRSVNGVVKAVPAGAALRLADRRVLGL